MENAKKLEKKALGGAATEGGTPTGVAAPPNAAAAMGSDGVSVVQRPLHPDPQVAAKPVRRRFDKTYKWNILQQADACVGTGQIGALLRREGLYSSHLANWRREHRENPLDGKTAKKRGLKTATPDPRVSQLQRENVRLTARLKKAELILEIQKKVSEILGIPLKTLDNEGSDS
jgi:transposase-like protein